MSLASLSYLALLGGTVLIALAEFAWRASGASRPTFWAVGLPWTLRERYRGPGFLLQLAGRPLVVAALVVRLCVWAGVLS